MELISVVKQLNKTTERLGKSTKEVFRMAKERAETERIYRMELSKEKYRLLDQQLPATLIDDLSKGNIAELKYERDLAKELHRSAMQSISALEVEVQAWQSILRNLDET